MTGGACSPNHASPSKALRPGRLVSGILTAVLAAAALAVVAAATRQDEPASLNISGLNEFTRKLTFTVRSYKDPDRDLTAYTTFGFDFVSKDEPLLEKELAKALQPHLEAKGLKRQDTDAQMLVRITSKVQSGPENLYVRYLQVNFLDGAALASAKESTVPPAVWRGEAADVGAESDIRSVAEPMFREILTEFPTRNEKGERRDWSCHRRGEIGVEVDRQDWRVIKVVRPGSPAALAGVQVSDSLEKVNDLSMSWRMSYRPERERDAAKRENWVEQDWLFIRWYSDTGNRMILTLRSADRKTRTVVLPLAIREVCDPL